MLRLVGAAVAVAWALAGWRNMPRLEQPSAEAAGFAIAGTCLLCMWIGARATRNHAVAVATAKAEAHAAALAHSNAAAAANAQVVVNVTEGARMQGAARLGGLDSAPWFVDSQHVDHDAIAAAVEDGGILEDLEVEHAE